jgi:antitoxin (DNA-binding transcriptional repressor) of toxin-antitoxin stability system
MRALSLAPQPPDFDDPPWLAQRSLVKRLDTYVRIRENEEMEQIQASELPRAVPWLLDQAENGEIIGLYRRGSVVAVVVPIKNYNNARSVPGYYWPEAPEVTRTKPAEVRVAQEQRT